MEQEKPQSERNFFLRKLHLPSDELHEETEASTWLENLMLTFRCSWGGM